MSLSVLKVGDRVTRMVHGQRSHGAKKRAEEGVVELVIPPGQLIEYECRRFDVRKPDGASGARNHVSYVVRVGTKLYWPRVAGLRATGEHVAPAAWVAGCEPDEVTLARVRGRDNWRDSDLSRVRQDAIVLRAEVDRLRALLAARTP